MSKTILIVDDDGLVRRSLASMLRSKDVIVLEAGNGLLALEKVKENDIDLLITDIRMPEMDGIDMVEKLRSTAKGKNIRVVILSTDDETTSVNRAMKLGIFTYLSKTTLDLDSICGQIKQILVNR